MSSHDTAHAGHHEQSNSKSAFSASFWFVMILVGLFIASLNFISAMSHDEGHGGGHATTHEAAATPHEGGEAAPAEGHEAAHHEATAADTTHHEEAAHH